MQQILYSVILKRITLWITLLVSFFAGSLIGVIADADEITQDFVRFHIVANSNTEQDQAVKWKVREAIFSEMDFSSIDSKASAIRYFTENQEKIKEIANEVLLENHFPYHSLVSVGKRQFPIREYTNFVLPSGEYDAVSVILGEGKGENFFCVMYPSLCMIEGVTEQTESEQELLNNILTEKTAAVITGNKKQLVYKFKIAEIFKKVLPH